MQPSSVAFYIMKKLVNTLKVKRDSKRISVSRIALLGMLLALLITFKFVLGFVPGIEIISFLFIILGILLPVFDLTLLLVCFNLGVLIMYGFGAWWLAYWVIFPADAFISKGISKLTRNRFALALWGFIGGFSVCFWYFLSDLLFFDLPYAMLNVISAIPINLIEGVTTMICIITIGPLLTKAIKHSYPKFYNRELMWEFKELKRPKLGYSILTILVILSIIAIILLFVYNDSFLHWKEHLYNQQFKRRGELPE